MKKKFLVVALCLACVSAYAQKRPAKKRTRKTTTTQQTQPQAQQQLNSQQDNVVSQPVGDTSKRKAFDPNKPFERPLDGYYKKNNILNAKVTPLPNLRENDVAFAKRIWREIDIREKMNQYLASPKRRLIDVLLDAISAGELTAYDPTATKDDPGGDSFTVPLNANGARAKMADSSVVDKFDKDGNKIGSELRAGEFNPDSVVKFRIKEDWVFDRQRSVFEPRIVGIAPLIKPKAGGVDLDYQPAFWIYFPDARQVLATKEVVSRNSDATGLSFDDVFMKRMFASYIVKESNDKDERIKDYAQGIDRLYESEKIKKSLMDWELNLWSY
ncbi:gliding motility protein GldN [Mucilaginibacter sp. SP1R1]|uniref:type IX secretion system ring protein PorN/GldN n=1 Tax=Mucilaginibacter sp. SP1R1 TaxID=2723091 RepID=UPI00162219F0|nr:gliding motility protein GldN [Mucilaginibacter sp. SP1R1]MBB6150797.1 gliding motility associated protein GldN [Mucilaginibacter sp. SP1R1]